MISVLWQDSTDDQYSKMTHMWHSQEDVWQHKSSLSS